MTGLARDGTDVPVDLRDARATAAAVRRARPDVVFHLAALSSVARSWEDPAATLAENTSSTLGVLEAVRTEAPHATVLLASSGEVYGSPASLPVDESAPLRPQSPYAVAKASADLLAGFYADAHGLHVVRARAFNHAGPGQRDGFVVASLTLQAARGVRAGAAEVRIVTGAPDTRRDFTDVRDVVRAYRLLASGAEPGIYHVCSGSTASAAEIVGLIRDALAGRARVVHVVDPARVRAHEVPEIRGSHERLTTATGWTPEIPFERTVADTLAWWGDELGRS